MATYGRSTVCKSKNKNKVKLKVKVKVKEAVTLVVLSGCRQNTLKNETKDSMIPNTLGRDTKQPRRRSDLVRQRQLRQAMGCPMEDNLKRGGIREDHYDV